jgi:hypothetical protein
MPSVARSARDGLQPCLSDPDCSDSKYLSGPRMRGRQNPRQLVQARRWLSEDKPDGCSITSRNQTGRRNASMPLSGQNAQTKDAENDDEK